VRLPGEFDHGASSIASIFFAPRRKGAKFAKNTGNKSRDSSDSLEKDYRYSLIGFAPFAPGRLCAHKN
jgi:hypothetical protein